MTEGQRNILIVAAIAVVGSLFFSDAFGVGAGTANFLINIAFRILIIWFLVVLYQRHSGTIATMPSTPRLVLQACGIFLLLLLSLGLIALVFALAGSASPLEILSEPVIFWPALLASIFGIWWAWQQRTSRW